MSAKKAAFIVPGFKHQASERQYQWMIAYFEARGFAVFSHAVVWDRRVLTDWVQDFSHYYSQYKLEENYVIGFSYGAMIAYASAPQLKPDVLMLCSLSPYFAEDLPHLKPWWKKFIGKHRLEDFKKYSALSIGRRISSKTYVFYGGAEAQKYPGLKKRCESAAGNVQQIELIVAGQAPHEIDHPDYQRAIKSVV